MSNIYLIRHGQASLGKANYDELSELGQRQAQILGQHFNKLDIRPDLVITGSMQRHKQTAAGILNAYNDSSDISKLENNGWNEFDFECLIRAYLSELSPDTKRPSKPSEFFSALRKALLSWSQGRITAKLPETWQDFETRVETALNQTIKNASKTIFVVSSGGAISMALKHLMGLPSSVMVDLNLQSKNTGVTELFSKHDQCYVSSFNHTSHLSLPEYSSLITHA